MVDFDIKSQLDLLNDYLDREMEGLKTEYFVIKPGIKASGENRSVTVDGDASTSVANGSQNDCNKDRLLYTWQTYKNNSVWYPHTVSKKRSKAIDIINPKTGEKVLI
ncbi:uncharacterized protein LOC112598712 [Melanaphis sacchari]|uniref:uncharacterized protein LOC112598712 n=1 Tax=Melanaphis sacchari TaxID=742174 RepID=UPI000DC142C9|nr:uncharacterized protein LOC112598712 [Melanaphis sacchari]